MNSASLFIAAFMLGVFAGFLFYFYALDNFKEWRKEVIDREYAEFDSKTGSLVWKSDRKDVPQ